MLRVIIDRFEGKYAICEKDDRTTINIEITKLHAGAKEGDIVVLGDERISIDTSAIQERKNRLKKIMDELWE